MDFATRPIMEMPDEFFENVYGGQVMSVAKLRVFRGDSQGGEEKEYEVPVDEEW